MLQGLRAPCPFVLLPRLKSPAEFAAVREKGGSASKSAHFVLHFCPHTAPTTPPIQAPAAASTLAEPGSLVKIGAVLPKRWAKRAVTRNTLKRQIYTVSFAFAPDLRAGSYVVRLRAEFSRKEFPSATSDALKTAVRSELQSLFASACP